MEACTKFQVAQSKNAYRFSHELFWNEFHKLYTNVKWYDICTNIIQPMAHVIKNTIESTVDDIQHC